MDSAVYRAKHDEHGRFMIWHHTVSDNNGRTITKVKAEYRRQPVEAEYVLEEGKTELREGWTIWTRGWDFKPRAWYPLPAITEAPRAA